jgi:hypothetical protein
VSAEAKSSDSAVRLVGWDEPPKRRRFGLVNRRGGSSAGEPAEPNRFDVTDFLCDGPSQKRNCSWRILTEPQFDRLGALNMGGARVNPIESRGNLHAVDNCQRTLMSWASECLEAGIRIRRSRTLSLTLKSRAGLLCRSRVTHGDGFTAPIMTGTDAWSRSGARPKVPAITPERS